MHLSTWALALSLVFFGAAVSARIQDRPRVSPTSVICMAIALVPAVFALMTLTLGVDRHTLIQNPAELVIGIFVTVVAVFYLLPVYVNGLIFRLELAGDEPA